MTRHTFERTVTDADVQRVRELHAAGISPAEITRRLGTVSTSTIRRIVRGERAAAGPAPAQLRRNGPLRRAARAYIRALRDANALDDGDQVLTTALESIAGALDVDPSSAMLWKELRQYATLLRKRDGDSSDEVQSTLLKLHAPLFDDSAPGTPDAS